jgi:uncharacterized protein YecE (DUF72 family)
MTYARWASSVPDDFLFSVKVPKVATHERRLVDAGEVLDAFLAEATQLGERLGPLLVQLPAEPVLLRRRRGEVLRRAEGPIRGRRGPRAQARELVRPRGRPARHAVSRRTGAADPAVVPAAAEPGGWDGLVYHRLHGSPKVYHSAYADEYLGALAKSLASAARSAAVWCVFDNTAAGAATANALDVLGRI